MKSLPPPVVQDVANLLGLANNQRLSSHPELMAVIRDVLRSYCTYRQASGNAKAVNAPQPLQLSQSLQDALRLHYKKPPSLIKDFITTLRKTKSPDVCPMCGSPKAGTLDHIFPKSIFAELSLFSLNLVPACDCNTKRNSAYIGTGPNERVLHPYFDNLMQQRLAHAQIKPSPSYGYNRPMITLMITTPIDSAEYAPVKYHFDHVVAPTDVLNYMDTTWPKFTNRPEDFFTIPSSKLTIIDFQQAAQDALIKNDRIFGTPNNWNSMLFAGVVNNQDAIRFLAHRVNDIRTGHYVPQGLP